MQDILQNLKRNDGLLDSEIAIAIGTSVAIACGRVVVLIILKTAITPLRSASNEAIVVA